VAFGEFPTFRPVQWVGTVLHSPRRAMTASPTAKETILVVDDEASIRRILETRLSMIGYQVVTASDGEEASTASCRTWWCST
jgi:PleD family two-component response regulator